MKKRLCSLLLVLTMLSTLLVAPASALEADGTDTAGAAAAYVYLGVKDYGTVSTKDPGKDNFVHRFFTGGSEVEYTVSADNRYAIQNTLQEGYVYNLTVEDGKVTAASAAEAAAEGEITAISAGTVTVSGTTCSYTSIYEISNNAAGSTAVTAVSGTDGLVGKTAKVYGDTLYLAFVAEDYTAPVSGTPGLKTLKNYLQTAMNPVGTTLYVFGAGWDWQDDLSSNQSMTIGLSQSWIDFFQQQDANYTYKNSADKAHSYYPHNSWNQYYYAGLDCSGYIGWVVYNVMNTESATNDQNDGYVMSSTKMAKTFANNGWGTWTRDIKSFKPGDIFSMSGHVWTVLGVCDDGSIVFLHSTPSDSKAGQGGGGVQLSALNPNGDDDKNCEAYKLVTKYMTKYYPEWSTRYDAVLRSYSSYATPASGSSFKETWSGNFSWNLDGTGLTDPDGYASMSADEILADLFGEPMPTTCENAVYLGIKGYGTEAADGDYMKLDEFTHLFSVNGETKEFTLSNVDGKYAIQNKLQEGYVYDLSTQDSVLNDANLAKAKAEGKIESATASSVTVGGKTYDIANVYEITNNTAGKATVTAKTAADLTAGATVKVYGDTAFLAFVAEDYTAPVSGTAGERTLKNYLQTALTPVGTALYVFGGAWDWQDVKSSNESMTIGLPQTWVDFFQQQTSDYTYKYIDPTTGYSYNPDSYYSNPGRFNQYYYGGPDCSGYIGWVIYNVMNTESATNDKNDGYVMYADEQAQRFANDYGWGSFTKDFTAKDFKPGDIFSMDDGHVWTVIGTCADGSIVFSHSTPSTGKTGNPGGGVQLSALNPSNPGSTDCEAYRLATYYMQKYYPEWSERYDAVLKDYDSYTEVSKDDSYWGGKFSWALDGTGLTDPNGYADMSAAEILADLFGEVDASYDNAVYLGVKDYGTVTTKNPGKDNFIHRFFVDGKIVELKVANDGRYTIQNTLQEGYVYDLTVENSVVTAAFAAEAQAEGTIDAINASRVTVSSSTVSYSGIYEISNNAAGATAVTAVSGIDGLVGKTAKVYDGTLYLTFIAEPYTAPVSGTPGLKTLKNYLKTAMNPVGTTLYVYGAGWDWQDDLSSNQSMTIGLSQSWIDFFQQQDANYTYKNSADKAHSYYPHNSWNQYYYAGLDCSGYIGWVAYNVMNTESSTNTTNDGYVMSSTKMAKTFANNGWGTWTRDITEFKPGDIFSMSGHVWTVVGVCDDGSIVFLHSTPSDSKAGQGGGGVQLSALNPNGDSDKDCEAYKLVTEYMTKYYPEWSTRYDAVLRSYSSYATPASGSSFKETWSGNFSWNLNGTGLTDPDGYASMSAAEILADLFSDADNQEPVTPVTPSKPSKPSQPEQPSQNGFVDVKPGDYFYDAVNWAVDKGVTSGTSATTFSPNASCTRAQIVTFLWRASGSPEPKAASNPFTDVAADAYYAKAVLWAVENGITKGTSDTTFSPDASCTRAQGVTFLWRANGAPAASAAASFTDVAADAYYAPAVAWAAEKNVVGGVGNGLFAPNAVCTRAQIVSMLYRLSK